LRGGFRIGAVVVSHRDTMRAVAVVAVGMLLHLVGVKLVAAVVVILELRGFVLEKAQTGLLTGAVVIEKIWVV
jgi:hypothetical protein